MPPRQAAVAIAFLYLVLGLLWISYSDTLLLKLAQESYYLNQLQTYKGWFFVSVTALLLYGFAYRAMKRERHLVENDRLTGLLNRSMFESELIQEVKQAKANQAHLAVIILNIDGFKQINKHAGLEAGDQFLIDVAHILRECCNHRTLIARLGNDEFALALPDATWPQDIEPVLNQILQRIRSIKVHQVPLLQFSASAGIALFPRDGEYAKVLIDAATHAMDLAQSKNIGGYYLFNAKISARATDQEKLLIDLKTAVSQCQFKLVYQPQFCTKTHQIIGVEVLVRWEHPTRGLVSPCEFIPLAESHHLIHGITDFVMRQAIEELTDANLLYHHIHRVSFNISAADFMHKQRSQRLVNNLSGLAGDWSVVTLELTESTALLNSEGVKQVLSPLTKRGVQVALDDFGTGYSSINTLRQLPISEVKIDRSFVTDIMENQQDAKLVKTILAMAKALNLRVVAEGVENHEQAAYLTRAGCDGIQGYLYARPMSIGQLTIFIQNRQQPSLS